MDVEHIYDYCRENNAKELKNLIIRKGKEIIYDAEKEHITPLHVAVIYNSTECIQILIECGSKTIAQDILGWPTILYAVGNIIEENDSIEVLSILIEAGADVNAKNRHGFTPLHNASQNKSIECLELLLRSGADVNAIEKIGGIAPLHEAAFVNSIECMKLLINYGADITIKDTRGKTFLECIQDEIIKKEMEDYVHSLASLDIKEPSY